MIAGIFSSIINTTDWMPFSRPTVRILFTRTFYDNLFTIDLDDDGIAAVRDAKILSVISISEEGEVRIATSDAEAEDTEANVVTFSPGVKKNITNPLNGEAVEVSRVLFRVVNCFPSC